MGFPLDRVLREMDPEEATAFVADIWARSGWETAADGPVITATRAGERRQLLVCHDGSTDANAAIDAAVSTGNDERAAALADRCGAELVDATDLYRRLAYGMSVDERDRLADRYIDAEAVSAPASAESTATANQSDERTTAARSTESETTTESDDETRTAAERTTESTPERDPTSDNRDESGRTATGIGVTRRVAATAVLLALLAVGSTVALGVAPGWQASAGESATTDAGDLPTTESGDAVLDTISSVTTAPDRDGQRRYVGLVPTCNRPPGLVVKIQLGALRQNDETLDKGIHTVWQFASPEIRQQIGSYSEFVEIVNSSRYRPMFEYTRAEYAPIRVENGVAQQRVTLTSPNGSTATYEFRLSKQTGGEHDGCWMTNGVERVDENAAVARQ